MLARTQPNVVCANTTDLVVIWLNPGARTLHSGWCEILSCADSCHFLPALSSCRFNFTTSAKLLFICNVSQKCRLMNETILGVEHSWANPQSPVPNKVSYNVLQLVVWKHPNVATENSSRETQQRAYWRLRKTATQDCRRANDVIEIAVFLKLQFSKYLYIYMYIYLCVCVKIKVDHKVPLFPTQKMAAFPHNWWHPRCFPMSSVQLVMGRWSLWHA